MSEFKVGDKVVFKSSRLGGHVRTVKEVFITGGDTHLVWNRDGFHINLLRHATPEEIAAGHRIDNDMGDDSHIENHISPNCQSRDV
ncbi:hypothetical protein [Acinetobacter baumannii]|uniref:hypothetical protein n=1 Tax=Acinetobacter baumannii TaxID=470 RepID=UPI003892649D